MSKEPTAAEKMIGDCAPKLTELTDNVLSGDVWERKGLSKRDRSPATVSALIALNRPEQLRFRLGRAGLAQSEALLSWGTETPPIAELGSASARVPAHTGRCS